MSVSRKRFIAGAVCPKCQSQDTLAMWQENKVDIVECVSCGHIQRQTDEAVTSHIRGQEQVIGIFTPQ
ncbi:YheV family putative zinc ribbon protein [Xenorhabdus mauleonii]|uniref:YheV family putative zinc ribbon protein n=1 Tax=Xenorhabdus mauleonii TaxID=351675 RepID=UPI000B886135|nr:YheV family putative zinc ribbon protein [Xenorhabdus mauleonii]